MSIENRQDEYVQSQGMIIFSKVKRIFTFRKMYFSRAISEYHLPIVCEFSQILPDMFYVLSLTDIRRDSSPIPQNPIEFPLTRCILQTSGFCS